VKKLLFSILLCTLLLINVVSAEIFSFDNVVSYEQDDLKATIINFFGIGGEIGSVELKSHSSITEVKRVIAGKDRAVMWYEFSGWEDIYVNGLGTVEFTDMRKGKKVDKDYYFAKAVYQDVEVNDYGEVCELKDVNKTMTNVCENKIVGTHIENQRVGWEKLTEKNIPKEITTIALITDVEPGEYLDGVWTIAGKKIDKHAEWTESLNDDLIVYYTFDVDGTEAVDGTAECLGTATHYDTGGIIGGFYNFTGANYLQCLPYAPMNLSGQQDFTMSAWVKTADGSGGIVTMPKSGSVALYGFYDQGAYIEMGVDTLGGHKIADWNPETGQGTWKLLTLTKNSTHLVSYVDGTKITSTASSDAFSSAGGSNNLTIGVWLNLATFYKGGVDEVAVWNRTLTPTETSDLYNGGAGIQYIGSFDSSPIVTLNSPANNTNFSIQSVSFNCSAEDDFLIENVSLYIDDVLNYTLVDGVDNITELYTTLNFADGDYNYTCKATDNATTPQTTTAGKQRFRIDTTKPVVNILYPLNNTEILTTTSLTNITFNVSVSDNLGLKNCSYFNGSTNNSIVCNNNATVQLGEGYHNLSYYAYDTAGNLGSNSTTFFINYYNYSIIYNTTAIEESPTTIRLNLTSTILRSLAANLSYNGTIYTMSGTNTSTDALLNVTLTTPKVTADTPINFTIFFNINGADGNTGNTSQLIYNIPDLVVQSSPCTDLAINFTLKDEANFTQLNGTFEYNFIYGSQGNNTYSRKYGEIKDNFGFYVCINSTISNNWSLGEGEIFYTSPGYVDRRYYLFSNMSLTNLTNNITLYDLVSSAQTSFKLEVEDTSLNPYQDKYTALIRWYSDLNEYNVVDMGKTDEDGSTVIHVRTEDVDYRIGVYEKNGEVIKLANPIRMVCLVTPCTYTLRISPTDTDFTSFLNIDYLFEYNATTSMWTFTWTDTSQTTSNMNLTVYKMTGTEVYPVCSNTVSGYTGAVTCNTSAYSGTLKGVVERSASPPIPITQKIIETATTAFRSEFGLFLGLLIGIPIIFIFAFMSPIGAIIGGVVALIPSLYFGAINWTILGGIAILAGIVLHFLKRIG